MSPIDSTDTLAHVAASRCSAGPSFSDSAHMTGSVGGDRKYVFSPQTCIELLDSDVLSPTQLKRERQLLELMGLDSVISAFGDRDYIKQAIELELEYPDTKTHFLCIQNDIKKLTSNINAVSEISRQTFEKIEAAEAKFRWSDDSTAAGPMVGYLATLDSSQSVISEGEDLLRSLKSTVTDRQNTHESTLNSSQSFEYGITNVCEVLSFDDIDFRDLKVSDILGQLDISKKESMHRQTAYFGDIGYKYGQNVHPPSPYPDCEVMDTVRERMEANIPDFSFSNYTCLVNFYPHGGSGIPMHSDSQQAVDGSDIWTVSVGAERSLRLVNQKGNISETHVVIPHGSVYRMTVDSQQQWKHGIDFDSTITEPRISFTFRQLNEIDSNIPNREPIPPIKLPVRCNSRDRILFISDSILKDVSDADLEVSNHRCVKVDNDQLSRIFEIEDEFAISDIVVISCGINDISRYQCTGYELFNMIRDKLMACCRKYEGTTFIFNSVLHTRYASLDREVDVLNKLMFELSCQISNLLFIDSLSVLKSCDLKIDDVIRASDRHGVHLTSRAVNKVREVLSRAVEVVVCGRTDTRPSKEIRGWIWPLARCRITALERARDELRSNFVYQPEYRNRPMFFR